MARCSTCNDTRVVKVLVCEEEQIRTCLDCPKSEPEVKVAEEIKPILLDDYDRIHLFAASRKFKVPPCPGAW